MRNLSICAFIATFAIISCNRDSFTGETLRIDYYSVGNCDTETEQLVSMERTSRWSGPVCNTIDTEDLGAYTVVIRDNETGAILYKKGFCTLFGEWRTTEEAKHTEEKYYNSLSVPMPCRPAVVEILARDRKTMEFNLTGSFPIEPAEIGECSLKHNDITEIQVYGDITTKVDLTFLAEGYRAEEKEMFLSDVRRFAENLISCPPFCKHREDFNIRAVMLPSDSSGVDHPEKGLDRSTALNSNYGTFGTDRYLTTRDMKSVADAIWDVPTDAVVILANEDVYGGGGIYNFYAISSTNDKRSLGVFNHEFGHSFGALADEYFTKNVPYGEDSFYCLDKEPWEPNITTLVDFDRKWKDLLPEGAEIPTSVADSSMIPEIGVFEGGGYLSKGIYRPADCCMMRNYAPFCAACTRSVERIIDFTCDRR